MKSRKGGWGERGRGKEGREGGMEAWREGGKCRKGEEGGRGRRERREIEEGRRKRK